MKNIYLLLFVFIFSSQLFAQITQSSIENALDESGRIKKGVSGSYNATGYTLTYGENGEPILKKSSLNKTQSFSWSTMGQVPGTDAQVHAVAVDANGIVYIGGEFGWPHKSFAKWDGVEWSSMGYVNGSVYAIAFRGSDVYVGGDFSDVNGNTAIQNIAKWDGSSWSALSTIFNYSHVNAVYAIAVSDPFVYVGGDFVVDLNPGWSEETSNIAKWNCNDSTWSEVGGGVDQTGIRVLAVDGSGNIYAGGTFLNAGASSANRIAKWNGTTWSALGSGLNNDVNAIAIDGSGNVYAGGVFTTAGGNTAKLIAKWNGSSWSELGGGVTSSWSTVNSILVDGTDVYVGGDFSGVGGIAISDIAKWNGSSWSSLSSSINGNEINSIALYGGNLYIGGNFSNAGDILTSSGVVAFNIVQWDGFNWIPMGEGPGSSGGLTGEVFTVAIDGSDIYFGGNFLQAGGMRVNNIAGWNGSNWFALGSGMNGYVYSIVVTGPYIYAGGSFTTAGGNQASRIARWARPSELNPTGGWEALVDGSFEGTNGDVRAMVTHPDGNLYVGGFFTEVATKTANYLAKWSGSSWAPVEALWPDAINNYVLALAVSNSGDLYLGGGFTQVAGISANRIAKWDGANWSALGSGVDGDVHSITTDGTDVYAGGQFSYSGSTELNKIAKWDGTTWSALGMGVGGTTYAIVAKNGYIYVGGDIPTLYNSASSTISVNNIGRWDGSSWSAVGDGVLGYVRALTVSTSAGAMWVGGSFYALGDYVTGSAYAAKFTDSQNPFPVELISFSGNVLNNSVKLNWQTATEVNNYGFEIERASIRSKERNYSATNEWETIGFVEGHGNSNSPNKYSFVDPITDGKILRYRLKQIDTDGSFEYSDVVEISQNNLYKFNLSQNYPNPFNPSTTISFTVPKAGMTKLSIYNILGEEISVVVNKELKAGSYSYSFNGNELSSGIYFYKLQSNDFVSVKKMMLLK